MDYRKYGKIVLLFFRDAFALYLILYCSFLILSDYQEIQSLGAYSNYLESRRVYPDNLSGYYRKADEFCFVVLPILTILLSLGIKLFLLQFKKSNLN